ncbi:hypothetical protein HK097_010257 [Rhizophlyctis rosea]|uniref:CENP-V/GFA domain-containing protein n=1 Tax=Rhizophlyctis rosea TaxID=64517 RepID=A0AAD5X393_9FUNG|nr:hypothetical protein HK097_010257 [Rhizophlyctis rosea]
MSNKYAADLSVPPTPIKGACPCRSFTFTLSHTPTKLNSCNCSFCSKRATLYANYPPSAVTIDSNTHDGVYANKPEIGRFHFCNKCGCGTYTEAAEWEMDEAVGQYKMKEGEWRVSIDARLIEGEEVGFDVKKVEVDVIDGKNLW